MLGSLPAGVVSTRGYLGCLAGLELGQEAAHPLAGGDTLVPSTEVTQGCTGDHIAATNITYFMRCYGPILFILTTVVRRDGMEVHCTNSNPLSSGLTLDSPLQFSLWQENY